MTPNRSLVTALVLLSLVATAPAQDDPVTAEWRALPDGVVGPLAPFDGPGPNEGESVGMVVPYILKHHAERLGANILNKQHLRLVELRATSRFLAGAVQQAFATCRDRSAAVVKQAPNHFEVWAIDADLTREFEPTTHPIGQAVVNATDELSLLGTMLRRDVQHEPVYRSTPVRVDARAVELVAVVASNAPDADVLDPLKHAEIWTTKHGDDDGKDEGKARDFVGDEPPVPADQGASYRRPLRALWYSTKGAYGQFAESLYTTVHNQAMAGNRDGAVELMLAAVTEPWPVAGTVDATVLVQAAVYGATYRHGHEDLVAAIVDRVLPVIEGVDGMELHPYAVERLLYYGSAERAAAYASTHGLAAMPADHRARRCGMTVGELLARLQQATE